VSIVSQVPIGTSHTAGCLLYLSLALCLHIYNRTVHTFTSITIFPTLFLRPLCHFFVLLPPPQNTGYTKKFSPYLTGNIQFFY
jgi:hypothetical protein